MRISTSRATFVLLIGLMCGVEGGCGGEDRLSGTPTNLPPNSMPPAPPLTQSPADLAKTRKVGAKKAPAKSSPGS